MFERNSELLQSMDMSISFARSTFLFVQRCDRQTYDYIFLLACATKNEFANEEKTEVLGE